MGNCLGVEKDRTGKGSKRSSHSGSTSPSEKFKDRSQSGKTPKPQAPTSFQSRSLPKLILDLPPNKVTDDYDLGQELGRGLFGVTRVAVQKSSGNKFACKSVSKKKLRPDSYENIQKEVKILKHLTGSPQVAGLVAVYEDEEAVHFVLELCSGGMLYDSITAREKYSEKEAASIVRSILEIVRFLHAQGVIHRDLKLENFMWATKEPNAQLKAIDFGLSTFYEPDQKFRQLVGSAYYVAPEVLRRSYGKEADIWSVGVIMYMLLCGLPPFWDVSERGICDKVLEGEYDMEEDPWPNISDSAKECLRHMLEMDVAKRWTPTQLLEHPWVREDGCASDLMINCPVLQRVKQFMNMNKLKRLALNVLVDSIDPEEERVIREKFNRFDADGDGQITFEEMQRGIKMVGLDIPDENIRAMLAAADLDNSGGINFTEYAATIMVKRLDNDRIRKAFEHFDKDGKGYIEAASLRSALEGESAETVEQVLAEVDKNHDGRIDFEEFASMMRDGAILGRNLSTMDRAGMLMELEHEYPQCPAIKEEPEASSSTSGTSGAQPEAAA